MAFPTYKNAFYLKTASPLISHLSNQTLDPPPAAKRPGTPAFPSSWPQLPSFLLRSSSTPNSPQKGSRDSCPTDQKTASSGPPWLAQGWTHDSVPSQRDPVPGHFMEPPGRTSLSLAMEDTSLKLLGTPALQVAAGEGPHFRGKWNQKTKGVQVLGTPALLARPGFVYMCL